ncbi:hypothetical protein JHN59_22515 [Streptomyces sp. MBT49]|nr:hypothetical protein [Streptomyces sp. MBT49]
MNSGVRPMSTASSPVRALREMSYTGTFVRPVPHSSTIEATAASASQEAGSSQSMSELPATSGSDGSSPSL